MKFPAFRTNFKLKEHPEINGALIYTVKQLWQIKIFKILTLVVHQRCNLIAFPGPRPVSLWPHVIARHKSQVLFNLVWRIWWRQEVGEMKISVFTCMYGEWVKGHKFQKLRWSHLSLLILHYTYYKKNVYINIYMYIVKKNNLKIW